MLMQSSQTARMSSLCFSHTAEGWYFSFLLQRYEMVRWHFHIIGWLSHIQPDTHPHTELDTAKASNVQKRNVLLKLIRIRMQNGRLLDVSNKFRKISCCCVFSCFPFPKTCSNVGHAEDSCKALSSLASTVNAKTETLSTQRRDDQTNSFKKHWPQNPMFYQPEAP